MATKIEGSELDFANFEFLRVYSIKWLYNRPNTRMVSGFVYSKSSLLQHIKESGLTSIIETEEEKLAVLLVKT